MNAKMKKQTFVMFRVKKSQLVIALIGALISIGSDTMAAPSQEKDGGQQQQQAKVVGPLYEFGGKLLAQLNKEDGSKNVVVSPVSIHQALNLVLLGSDASSQTKTELLNVIGYGNLSDADVEGCHSDYANLMTEFERVTKDTLQKRKEFEASNKDNTDRSKWDISDAQPRSPVLDLFTMMVTKNKAEANPDYEKDITKYYHASISNIDDKKPETKSALLKRMNDWGKEAGFESPVMNPNYLDDKFEAILISAIRAEAFWWDDFTESDDEKVFYNYGSKDKPVSGKFLANSNPRGSRLIEFTTSERATIRYIYENFSKDKNYGQLSDLDFRAVEIPLLDMLSFTILEPLNCCNVSAGNSSIARLNKLAENLFDKFPGETTTKLAKVLELLDQDREGNQLDYLKMPKFKFESDIDLNSALKSLGLKRAFDREHAEISRITRNKLCVNEIKHKAMIETTRTGIKAAGVTMIKMMMLSALQKNQHVDIVIENPFLFVLRYQKMPLFIGQLTNL